MFDRSCLKALLIAGLALPIASCSNTGLSKILIAPASVSMSVGQYVQFTAWGYYGNAKATIQPNQDITSQVTWGWGTSILTQVTTTQAPNCAVPVKGICSGLFLAVGVGSTSVGATAPGFGGSVGQDAAVTVSPCTSNCGSGGSIAEPIIALSITPSTDSVAVVGQTAQFIALGTNGTSGLQQNVSNTTPVAGVNGISWSSSNAGVATICTPGAAAPCTSSTNGLATATGTGTTQITAIWTNPDFSVQTATATFTVTGTASEPLQSLAITPSTQSVLQGQSSQLIAIGAFSSTASTPGTQNLTSSSTVTWASSNKSVASITAGGSSCATPATGCGGFVTGNSAGTAVLTAIASNPDKSVVTATATITVTATGSGSSEPLVSLAVLPGSQTSLTTGASANVNFIAIGTTATGATVNMTSASYTPAGTATPIAAVTWTSSNPAVAAICSASAGATAPCSSTVGGIATPKSAGATAITAIATNPDGTVVTGSAAYTVSVPSVTEPYVSVAIVPASQTLTTVGQTGSFIAIGTTGAGATVDLTNAPGAIWSANSSGVASLVSNGVFKAVANGVTAITVEVPNPGINGNPPDGTSVSATGSLTVALATTPEPLLSMSIVPGSQTVAWTGQTTQFLAIGDFSSSSSTPGEQNMTGVSTYTTAWYSSNPSVATICTTGSAAPCTSSTNGLAIAVGPGTTAITAIATNNTDHSAVTASATFTVTGSTPNQIVSLTIIPGAQTVTLPLTPSTYTPTNPFVVIGTNGTGLQLPETGSVQWFSSNQAVATVNLTTGAVTPVAQGTTTITAQYTNPVTPTTPANVITASAALTVSGVAAEPLLGITIYPGTQTVNYPGQTSQLVATGTFSSAPVTQNLTTTAGQDQITWISSNPAVATVCSPANASLGIVANCPATPGLVTAVTQGTVAITAIASNPDKSVVTGVAAFTVTNGAPEQMTSLTIVPGSLALSATGQPGYFLAIGTSGATGLQEDVTNSSQIVWSSSVPAYATVSTTLAPTQTCVNNNATPPVQVCTNDMPGLAKGVSPGTTNITAEYTNPGATPTVVTANSSVTVTATPAAEPLLSINIAPTDVTVLDLEGNAQFLAFGTFSTTPTVLDITNGFFHSGFPAVGYPASACTAAYAAADAAYVAAAVASETPVNPASYPQPQCAFVPVTWVSLPDAFVFPINSAGSAGANGGLITAEGSGTEEVYAVAANPDGTLVYGAVGGGTGFATFNCPYAPPTYGTTTVTIGTVTTTTTDFNDILTIGTCNPLTIGNGLLSTLTVFDASSVSTGLDQANWLVQAPSATSNWTDPLLVLNCGGTNQQESVGGSVCEATYPNNSTVILNAPAESGVKFGGWSSNCTPCTLNTTTGACPAIVPPAPLYNAAGPNSCSVVVGGTCTYQQTTATYQCTQSNVSVGAIFN